MNPRTRWANAPDELHTIRWTPISAPEAAAYLTLDEAITRLTRDYDYDPEDIARIAASLAAGKAERTMFAYYQLDSAARATELSADR